MCDSGTIIGDANRAMSVEEIQENWDKITKLSDSKSLNQLNDSFDYLGDLLK